MDFLVRRGRGLDPAVLAWIMGTLGIGPGIGDVHFVAGETTAYYSKLRDDMKIHPSLIHHSIAAGEDAMTASQNDVLCVYPGSHVQSTTALGWDKVACHMLGMAPLQMLEHTVEITNGNADATPTTGNWLFSGNGCVVKNVCFRHRGAAANVMGCVISGDNQVFENVNFQTAANTALADEAGVKGTVLSGADETTFRRCVFGGTEIERTDGAADLWVGPNTCDNLFFYACMWVADLAAAADDDHAFIEFEAAADLDTLMYLEDPVFINAGAALDQQPDCITVSATLTGLIVIKNPMVVGALDIADNEEMVQILGHGIGGTTPGKLIGLALAPDVT